MITCSSHAALVAHGSLDETTGTTANGSVGTAHGIWEDGKQAGLSWEILNKQ